MHLFFSWIATLSFCVIWQMDRGWATHRFQCVLVSTPRHACVHWPSRLCRLQWPGMFGRPNLDSADPIASPGWIGRSTGDFRRFLETCLDWIQTLNEILLRYLVGPSRSFLGTAGIGRGRSYLVFTRSGYKAPCSSQTPGIRSLFVDLHSTVRLAQNSCQSSMSASDP